MTLGFWLQRALGEELNMKQVYDEAVEVICFNSVEIKPHVTRTCGKERRYGRIQLTVDKSLIGEIVDFKVLLRRVKKV
jgi:hypothetical protein